MWLRYCPILLFQTPSIFFEFFGSQINSNNSSLTNYTAFVASVATFCYGTQFYDRQGCELCFEVCKKEHRPSFSRWIIFEWMLHIRLLQLWLYFKLADKTKKTFFSVELGIICIESIKPYKPTHESFGNTCNCNRNIPEKQSVQYSFELTGEAAWPSPSK